MKDFTSGFKCKNWRDHREILYSLRKLQVLGKGADTSVSHLRKTSSELHISMRMTTVLYANQFSVSCIVLEKKSSRIFTSILKITVSFLVNMGTRVTFLQMLLPLTEYC